MKGENNMTIEHYDPKHIKNNPWQTRQRETDAEHIKDLALDIKKNGLLQIPIGRIITIDGAGAVQLAFGHNRLRAYLYLDLPLMPVDVRALTDEQMAAFAWSENEKRRDVMAIERARAIQQRINDFKWTNRQAADALGVDHSTISNMLRLLKLPDELQMANIEGKLSERQMEALLPLFEMPEENRKLIETNSYYYNQPAEIIREALAGHSSDYLRKEVDRYLNGASHDLEKAEFKLNELFKENEKIYCGTCNTCDRRMASRNRCFDGICFKTKTDWVHRLYLANASIESGYDMIDETKGGYTTDLPDGSWEKDLRAQILATRCPNIRLMYTENQSKDIAGFPHARLVCDKRNNSCTCIKGIKLLEHQNYFSKASAQEIIDDKGTREEMEEMEPGKPINSDKGEIVELETEPVINNLDLEDAVRECRKSKAEAVKKFDELQNKVEKLIKQSLFELKPGAFYPLMRSYGIPMEGELDLDVIFDDLAERVARYVLPENYDDLEDLLRIIDLHLENLELGKLEDFEKIIVVPVDQDTKIPVL